MSQGIIDKGWNINWSFRGRVDQVTDEMIRTAKKAGCNLMSLGAEDYTDEGLKLINKRITTKQIQHAVSIVKKHGIDLNINWIVGLPRHKKNSDIDGLLTFAKKLNTAYQEFTILIPYYGTQIYREGVEKGIIQEGIWEDFVKNPTPDFLLPVWEESFTREELSRIYHRCYKSYYYRPGYILKSLVRTKSASELYKKAVAALKLAGLKTKKKSITAGTVSKANRKIYNALSENYETVDGRRTDRLLNWVRGEIVKIKRDNSIDDHAGLLDLGCGQGFIGRATEKLFKFRTGVDISENIIQHARPFYEKVEAADVYSYQDGEKYDVATAFAVLHHIYDHDEFFRAVYANLKKGGVFYSDHDISRSFVNLFYPALKLFRIAARGYAKYLDPERGIDKKVYDLAEVHEDGIATGKLKSALSKAGFSDVQIQYHWYGSFGVFDTIFGKRLFPRGLAPNVRIIAKK